VGSHSPGVCPLSHCYLHMETDTKLTVLSLKITENTIQNVENIKQILKWHFLLLLDNRYQVECSYYPGETFGKMVVNCISQYWSSGHCAKPWGNYENKDTTWTSRDFTVLFGKKKKYQLLTTRSHSLKITHDIKFRKDPGDRDSLKHAHLNRRFCILLEVFYIYPELGDQEILKPKGQGCWL
jgi:hypothetical protein